MRPITYGIRLYAGDTSRIHLGGYEEGVNLLNSSIPDRMDVETFPVIGGRFLVIQDFYSGRDTQFASIVIFDRSTSIGIGDNIFPPRYIINITAVGVSNTSLPPSSLNDDLIGTPGDDTISLLGGDDRYSALDGDDVVFGNAGNDKLIGNDGADVLLGGQGDDVLLGGPGNDTLVGEEGDDVLDGGPGLDRAQFSFPLAAAAVSVSASGETIVAGPGGTDAVRGVEQFQFSDRAIDNADGSPLVDDLFYLATYQDVAASGLDPDAHYAAFGFREGRDPNASFSAAGYLAANPDVRTAGVNPLTHYDQVGFREGRDPGASFDTELYLAGNPDYRAAGVDPLAHFIQFGQAEGRTISPAIGRARDIGAAHSFDAEYYLLANADVARASMASGDDPFAFALNHFDRFGWHEGRNPNAVFDTNDYLEAYADVREAGVNPLQHYDQSGWHEGRDPSAAFSTLFYLTAYRDVATAGINPMQHYLQFGALEGRSMFEVSDLV